jgi:uncharacterized protein YyaL (SSP411 family)
MPSVLARVAEAFQSEPDPSRPRDLQPDTDAIGIRLDETQLIAQVFASFDSECGGFGVEPKFPHTAPLHLALELCADTPDPALERIVVASLDQMGWGALYDHVDGGFFRYATTRDWQLPHFEKLLDVNAALAHLYLEAGSKLHQTRFTDRASDTLRYIQTWLADPVDGGWFGSQQADDRYFASDSVERRRTLAAPPVATSLYSDSNAVMVSTALEAAKVFGDDGLREFAVKSLERVLLAVYKPGVGVAHYFDGHAHVRGLLADQLAMASACLDVFDLTGNIVYEMMAEELTHYAVRTMWDEARGGFFDRAGEDNEPPIGLMNCRLKPFVANCEAARMLVRLASASGEQDFARTATAALDAIHPLASSQGPLAAHYLLAVRAARAR